jgi:tetratricopeptide (TPR) repeat protein
MIQATIKTEAWHTCGTCKQALTGPMREILAEEWVRFLLRSPATPHMLLHEARVHLARVHIAAGRYTDAERILNEERTARASTSRSPSLMSALGECLKHQGRYADAERTYRELIASIEDTSSYDSLCARNSLGKVLIETDSKEAERIHRGVVETARRVMGPESAQVLSFTGELALAMMYNQRFEEARSMIDELVGRMSRVLGPVHPETLTTKGNLALALHLLGSSAEAASIQSAILAEITATLGPDHPSSVLYKANLAEYLSRSADPGSLQTAIQMAREVLDSNRAVLGPEHPDTLMCALNLSSLIIRLPRTAGSDRVGSDSSEAEEIIRTAVAIAERSGLPKTGMHRLGASTILATFLHSQGKRTEAVEVMNAMASSCKESLGEHSESTVAATKRLEYMAATKTAQDRDQDQERCIICLESESEPAPIQRGCVCRGKAGLSHIQCMIKLADYRDKNGPATEMPGLAWIMCLVCKSHFTGTMKHALAHAWSERSLHSPADDLMRVWSDQHLIECTYAAGNYAEAETMARSMLDRNRANLGETHPITLYTQTMLGNALCCLERYKDAEKVQREVLAATITVSGPRDRVTASQMTSLSNTLVKQRKFPEALRLAKEAVAILRADGANGAESRDSDREKMFLTSASGLAHLFLEQGDHDGARTLYSEVLSTQSRILGNDHPETLGTKANLAATMSRQGNYEEAKRLEIEVLRTMQRALGPTHPQAVCAKENLEYTLRCAQALQATGATKDTKSAKSANSANSKKGPGAAKG